ncbi:hypothetical protein [Xinfangfangia pollutisoli]|uniref:hypothetical protein n=1 Tax=Xinfangfangia pollutisoli TaxID=2865960 RepID=UPI001CD230B2|nr:hypothetical protein [Xinfangfangia pollutisoli]
MEGLTTTQLAERLAVSKARISQYVAEGKLAGCFTGAGRARRFDLARVAAALGRRLDLGQMAGNGLATRRALRDLAEGGPAAMPAPMPAPMREGGVLPLRDPDRLELATIQIKEEEARRRRRDNERDEGRWVLADEAQRQAARALAREIGQFEAVIREGARAVADRFGVEVREVRQVMLEEWRRHRARRRDQLRAEAGAADLSASERAATV